MFLFPLRTKIFHTHQTSEQCARNDRIHPEAQEANYLTTTCTKKACTLNYIPNPTAASTKWQTAPQVHEPNQQLKNNDKTASCTKCWDQSACTLMYVKQTNHAPNKCTFWSTCSKQQCAPTRECTKVIIIMCTQWHSAPWSTWTPIPTKEYIKE